MNPNSPQRRRRRSSARSDESVQKYVVKGDNRKQPSDKTKTRAAEARKVNSLDSMIAFLKITNWTHLLVGDGSCTGNWEYEAGFGCVVVPRRDPSQFFISHGAFNRGTNIVAEMFAYVLPLMQIAATEKISVRHVHIVTDCEYLPKAAANVQWQQKANSELWTMLRAFKRRGLVLHWHWVPRDILDLNKFCHDLANAARVATKGLAEEVISKHEFTTIHVSGNDLDEAPEEAGVDALTGVDCERCGKPATTETTEGETLCSECGAAVEAEQMRTVEE